MGNGVWILVAGLAGAALGALLMLLPARRRLQASADRVAHLELQRQQVGQQTTQARRQIEQLQKELGELRHLMLRRGVTPPQRQAVLEVSEVDVTTPGAPQAPEAFAPTQLIARQAASKAPGALEA